MPKEQDDAVRPVRCADLHNRSRNPDQRLRHPAERRQHPLQPGDYAVARVPRICRRTRRQACPTLCRPEPRPPARRTARSPAAPRARPAERGRGPVRRGHGLRAGRCLPRPNAFGACGPG
ncbi:hypothetical protein EO081_16605 [Sphingomonas desiccabilis]|uniref:Uncharacterized protein n=1 Tax=Sphingomonas desiccabilis TaxID=429134 RepID=A0A4Q2IPH8_9SPHN|nr:hypothetical protein EO081_16605 [Sphingomonas desiccabilis]